MKVSKLMLVLAALTTCFFACKKSITTQSGVSVAEFQYNWTFVNSIWSVSFNEQTIETDTIKGLAGDYVNFATNNMVYSQILGVKDTASYTDSSFYIFVNSNLLLPPTLSNPSLSDTFSITNVTSTFLSLSYTVSKDTSITINNGGTLTTYSGVFTGNDVISLSR